MTTRTVLTSPDGELRLLIFRERDDVTLGFDGYEWHTHGDVLAGEFTLRGVVDLEPEEAVTRFVSELTANETILAVLSVDGKIQKVWPTLQPKNDLKWQQPGETISFRFWSGSPYHAT